MSQPMNPSSADVATAKENIALLEKQVREKDIRLQDIRFTFTTPDRYRKQSIAYESGYESGWRGWSYNNPYTSVHHQDAYKAGYDIANQAVFLKMAFTGDVADKDKEWETACSKRKDGIHCNCWYDGKKCCACDDNGDNTNEDE